MRIIFFFCHAILYLYRRTLCPIFLLFLFFLSKARGHPTFCNGQPMCPHGPATVTNTHLRAYLFSIVSIKGGLKIDT